MHTQQKRVTAQLRMVNYKHKTKGYHNKKAEQNKLSPNWEGPYIVTRIVKEGTYMIGHPGGEELKYPWHASHLSTYFF